MNCYHVGDAAAGIVAPWGELDRPQQVSISTQPSPRERQTRALRSPGAAPDAGPGVRVFEVTGLRGGTLPLSDDRGESWSRLPGRRPDLIDLAVAAA